MTITDYQIRAHAFATYGGNPMYPLLGLAEEVGEVTGKVAKYIRKHSGKAPDGMEKDFFDFRDSIKKEIGDVLWMLSEVCFNCALSLEDVMKENIAKLEDRKARGVIVGDGDDR